MAREDNALKVDIILQQYVESELKEQDLESKVLDLSRNSNLWFLAREQINELAKVSKVLEMEGIRELFAKACGAYNRWLTIEEGIPLSVVDWGCGGGEKGIFVYEQLYGRAGTGGTLHFVDYARDTALTEATETARRKGIKVESHDENIATLAGGFFPKLVVPRIHCYFGNNLANLEEEEYYALGKGRLVGQLRGVVTNMKVKKDILLVEWFQRDKSYYEQPKARDVVLRNLELRLEPDAPEKVIEIVTDANGNVDYFVDNSNPEWFINCFRTHKPYLHGKSGRLIPAGTVIKTMKSRRFSDSEVIESCKKIGLEAMNLGPPNPNPELGETPQYEYGPVFPASWYYLQRGDKRYAAFQKVKDVRTGARAIKMLSAALAASVLALGTGYGHYLYKTRIYCIDGTVEHDEVRCTLNASESISIPFGEFLDAERQSDTKLLIRDAVRRTLLVPLDKEEMKEYSQLGQLHKKALEIFARSKRMTPDRYRFSRKSILDERKVSEDELLLHIGSLVGNERAVMKALALLDQIKRSDLQNELPEESRKYYPVFYDHFLDRLGQSAELDDDGHTLYRYIDLLSENIDLLRGILRCVKEGNLTTVWSGQSLLYGFSQVPHDGNIEELIKVTKLYVRKGLLCYELGYCEGHSYDILSTLASLGEKVEPKTMKRLAQLAGDVDKKKIRVTYDEHDEEVIYECGDLTPIEEIISFLDEHIEKAGSGEPVYRRSYNVDYDNQMSGFIDAMRRYHGIGHAQEVLYQINEIFNNSYYIHPAAKFMVAAEFVALLDQDCVFAKVKELSEKGGLDDYFQKIREKRYDIYSADEKELLEKLKQAGICD